MKILFLGGTEFFGKLIVDRLKVNLNTEVTVLSRCPSADIVGDRDDSETLQKISGHWDTIVDNIAYRSSQVEQLFNHVTTDHYVVTSSIASYYPKTSLYSKNKLEVEKWIWKHRPLATIIRPGIVFGPNDPEEKMIWYVRRILNNQEIPPRPDPRISWVFSEDLVYPYLKIIGGRHIGTSFDLCNKNPEKLHTLLWRMAYFLTKKPTIESYCSLLRKKAPYHHTLKRDFIGHPEFAMQMLDWKQSLLKDSLRKTMTWFKKQVLHEGAQSHS